MSHPEGSIPCKLLTDFPFRLIDRPNVQPWGVVRFDLGFNVGAVPDAGLSIGSSFGFDVGVLEHLELGGVAVPLAFYPDVQFTSPTIFAAYDICIIKALDLTPALGVHIPVQAADRWGLDLVAPFEITLSRSTELDPALTLSLGFADPMRVSLALPVALQIQVADWLDLTPAIGLDLTHLECSSGSGCKGVSFPLGLTAAFSVPYRGRPLVDFIVQWLWPELAQVGASGKGFHWEDWTLTLTASFFLLPALRHCSRPGAGAVLESPQPGSSGPYR